MPAKRFEESFARAVRIVPPRLMVWAAKKAQILNQRSHVFGDRQCLEAPDLLHDAFLWLRSRDEVFDPAQWPDEPPQRAAEFYLKNAIKAACNTLEKRQRRKSQRFGRLRAPHKRDDKGALRSPLEHFPDPATSVFDEQMVADDFLAYVERRSPTAGQVARYQVYGSSKTKDIANHFGKSDSWARAKKADIRAYFFEYYDLAEQNNGDS